MTERQSEKSSSHLTTLEQVDSWLAALPRHDLNAARRAISAAVKTLAESGEPLTVEGVTALVRLDAGCHETLLEILRHYFAAAAGNGTDENLRADMESIYGWLGAAYYRFVVADCKTGAGARPDAEFMVLVIGRALFALGNQVKWAYFVRASPPAACWRQLHTLYQAAEREGLVTAPVALYVHPHELSASGAGLYTRAALLNSLSSGSFTNRQIETADYWLLAWTSNLSADRHYVSGEHRYAALLGSDAPPRGIREPLDDPQVRYFRTETLAIEIGRARQTLREQATQLELGFIARRPLAEFAELLDKLAYLWAPADIREDRRKHQRAKVADQAVIVVRGLNNICEARQDEERGQGSKPDEEMDLPDSGLVNERHRGKLSTGRLDASQPPAALESWALADESVDGYGLKFPAESYRELRPGALIGIKRREAEHWAVGTVIRVRTNRSTNETMIGVQLVSLAPVVVTLGDDVPGVPTTIGQHVGGLFIRRDEPNAQPDTLILDTIQHIPDRRMIMGARNVRYAIRLGRTISSGEGWRRAAFDIIAKRS